MTTVQTTAPIELWRIARNFLCIFFALFGEPQAIATQGVTQKRPRALLLSWLRAGEALMRRLLLIEASAYSKPNTRPLLRAPRQRVRRLREFQADQPETWRVSFRAFIDTKPRQRAPRPPKPRKPRLSREERWCSEYWPRQTFHSAWPLAERVEAMLRVFNNPAPFAQRLARRLHATPHRSVELLAHTEETPNLIGPGAFATMSEAAQEARRKIEPG